MQAQSVVSRVNPLGDSSVAVFDGNSSGVSWGAVLAGAAAAAALSLVLFILGVGLGLSVISPWSYNTATIGKSTIIWLAFTQLIASGIGGYLAGRLRVKWASVHTDEVYFRDTAHGLLSWAVATLVTAIFLTGALRVVVGGAIDVGTAAGTAAATVATAGSDVPDTGTVGQVGYFSDLLLRSDNSMLAPDNLATRGEVVKIFVNDLLAGTMSADDRQYLSLIVAQHTGLSQPDAEKRVDDVYARLNKAKANAESATKEAADKARKAAAYSALWMFVALLLGAFFAGLLATFGGRQRDNVRCGMHS
ncbi:MAG: hypothetical protein HQK65_01660 [Desulfamplus sp.]|nr:hypothetical protein [Desulfamplus sp.]